MKACSLLHYWEWKYSQQQGSAQPPTATLDRALEGSSAAPISLTTTYDGVITESVEPLPAYTVVTPEEERISTTNAAPEPTLPATTACLHCAHQIVCPECGCNACAADSDIPATSAFGTLCARARRRGLRCGDSSALFQTPLQAPHDPPPASSIASTVVTPHRRLLPRIVAASTPVAADPTPSLSITSPTSAIPPKHTPALATKTCCFVDCSNEVTTTKACSTSCFRKWRFSQPVQPSTALASPLLQGKLIFGDLCSGHGNLLDAVAAITADSNCPFEASVAYACEVVLDLREAIAAKHNIPCYDDIKTIFEKELPPHNILHAAPPCQPFSVAGKALGSKDKRAEVMPYIAHLTQRWQPLIVIIEQAPGFYNWHSPGRHTKDGSSGPAFEDICARINRAGYHVDSRTLLACRFKSHQSRLRLWIVATRRNVVDAVGAFSFGSLPPREHLPFAELLTSDSSFTTVAPASKLTAIPFKHIDFKPHRLGSFNGQKVWSTTGLCPCVLTSKRHLFVHEGSIITPTVATLAKLQGLDPSSLPADDAVARKIVGNSIHRGMHIYVLSRAMEHATIAIEAGIPAFRPPAKVAWPEQLKSSKSSRTFDTVQVPTVHDTTPLHALPGVTPGTVDPPDPAPLDLDALEPSILKAVDRWALKVKQILLEQTLAKSWMPTSFPLQHYLPSHIKMHACMEDCAFVDPLPTSIPTLETNRRKAALASLRAMQSPQLAHAKAALEFIRNKFIRNCARTRDSSFASPVTPSAARWLQGQLPHLHDAAPTADPVLRALQKKELLSAPLTDARTAHMEPTTPRKNRHPWAGFSRPLSVASLHMHPKAFETDLAPFDSLVPAWSIYRGGSPQLEVPVTSFSSGDSVLKPFVNNPSPDVLLAWVTRTSDNHTFVKATISAIAKILQWSRPSVVILGTRESFWSSSQSHLDNTYNSLVHCLTGIGYVAKTYTAPCSKVTFNILVATEVASRLAFPDLFIPTASKSQMPSSAWLPVLDGLQSFLKPLHTFRVTNIEQVWPLAHNNAFTQWCREEAARAVAIKAGTPVPTSNVLVFDNDLMHPDARGVVWDLRKYWAARLKGIDDPSLIVPLFDQRQNNSRFNTSAICALTMDSPDDSFPDEATVYDLQHGSDNNAIPPKHSIICSNWKASYEFLDIGSADIATYEKRGWIEFVPEGGPPCIPFTSVAQNTVPKKGKDPKEFRRRVLDCGYDGDDLTRTVIASDAAQGTPTSTPAIYVPNHELLSLNARSDVTRQSPVSFSSYERLVHKIMVLNRSHLPVLMFKGDGDAWYKQFRRRLEQICDGVASWPSFIDDQPTMRLFLDYTLQFGDANAAHNTYRVTYMIIWILLRDMADRPAATDAVRGWQRLQLDMLEAGEIEVTNLSYADMDGFVDDFMAAVLKGEDEAMLVSFLGLMRYLKLDVSLKKLALEARPYHIKTLLGFRVDTKKMIGYLEDAWRELFIAELKAIQTKDNISVHDLQVIGGKSIRVCCLFPALRGFCNGTFTALRNTREFRGSRARLHPRHVNVLRKDTKLIHDVLVSAPSVQLLLNPHESMSIAQGALHCDSDASSSWGLGACIILDDKIYFLYEAWTDDEKEIFDIADFEGIALEMACRYFPAVAPRAFARKRMLARVDNTNVEGGVIKMDSTKGVTMLVVKSLLHLQVQYSFKLRCVRVTSEDNVLADALSRNALEDFLREAELMGLTPVRLKLTEQQRSTARFAAAKSELKP